MRFSLPLVSALAGAMLLSSCSPSSVGHTPPAAGSRAPQNMGGGGVDCTDPAYANDPSCSFGNGPPTPPPTTGGGGGGSRSFTPGVSKKGCPTLDLAADNALAVLPKSLMEFPGNVENGGMLWFNNADDLYYYQTPAQVIPIGPGGEGTLSQAFSQDTFQVVGWYHTHPYPNDGGPTDTNIDYNGTHFSSFDQNYSISNNNIIAYVGVYNFVNNGMGYHWYSWTPPTPSGGGGGVESTPGLIVSGGC